MNYKSNFILFFCLVLSLILFSCNDNKEDVQEKSFEQKLILPEFNIYPISEEIKMLKNDGIDFDYKLGEVSAFGDYKQIEIECFVKNNNEFDINFLGQSCYGLVYYLEFQTSDFQVSPLWNCNATYPMIGHLKAKEELSFKAHFLQLKNFNKKPFIGLDLRVIDRYIEYKKLLNNQELIEKIYRAKTKKSNIIWANI